MGISLEELKERVFCIIDEIIENELAVDNKGCEIPLHSFITNNRSLNNRCIRNFGSVRQTLVEYGYYTEELVISDESVTEYLRYCFHVNDNFKIICDKETLRNKLNELEIRGYDINKCKRIIKEIKKNMNLEKTEKFLDLTCVSELGDVQSRRCSENRTVGYSIVFCYADWRNFYEANGVDYRLVSSAYSFSKQKELMRLGNYFEKVVRNVLLRINQEVIDNHHIDKCKPDFVVGDTWFDAKLSKSTALNSGCKTIEKYRKHTDHLTIIYAIDDTDDLQGYEELAEFIHIKDYYPYITEELRREIDELIKSVKRIKETEVDDLETEESA